MSMNVLAIMEGARANVVIRMVPIIANARLDSDLMRTAGGVEVRQSPAHARTTKLDGKLPF